MAIQIDVVVVVIDRVHESLTSMRFVGMLVGSCFKLLYIIYVGCSPDVWSFGVLVYKCVVGHPLLR